LNPPRDLPDLKAIRKALRESSSGPLKPKELARALSVPQSSYVAFKKLLQGFEASGDLYRNRKNRYAVPANINLTVGSLRLTRAGDAFLRTDAPDGDDVFVPSQNLESAMDGDRVAVRIEGRPRGKAPVGRVVKILDRARPTLVGTYHATGRFGFVRPNDRRVFRDVMVPQGAEAGAKDGEVAVVRITQYGSARQNAVGEIETVLGRMDEPGVDVLAILHGHGLTDTFPKDVEGAAKEAAGLVEKPGQRVDRRELHVFTVDPADAKDHDDALSVTSAGKGTWEVGIHIADVSHFVREGSPLDMEAYRRGSSVYLVDQVVPMLPHLLSSDLCSLKEGADRFALSLFVTLDREGRVRSQRFERTLIRSRHGLDYGQVHRVLAGGRERGSGDGRGDPDAGPIWPGDSARSGASGGPWTSTSPRRGWSWTRTGSPVDIHRVVQLDSHRLIEDFMVLANEVVAREAEGRLLPLLYRVHDPRPGTAWKNCGPSCLGGAHPPPGQGVRKGPPGGAGPGAWATRGEPGLHGDPALHDPGPVRPRECGALRAGVEGLRPLYVTDPALSGSDRAPGGGTGPDRREGGPGALEKRSPGRDRGVGERKGAGGPAGRAGLGGDEEDRVHAAAPGRGLRGDDLVRDVIRVLRSP
jgi:ribonuclease R